jgi:hypothetical protein
LQSKSPLSYGFFLLFSDWLKKSLFFLVSLWFRVGISLVSLWFLFGFSCFSFSVAHFPKMSAIILPNSLRPGTDLMSKIVVRNPIIVNIITKTLLNSQDEYIPGESEWDDGTRSDLVLEPKTPLLHLPPIVVEFQHTVNIPFIKRAINYCLKAYNRYQNDPICLIVCIDTLSVDVYEQTEESGVPGCRSFSSWAWATKCLVLSQSSLVHCSTLLPLDPFVALGLFLTQQATSLAGAPCNEDPTMKLLYDLALEHYGSLVGNQQHMTEVIKQVCDTQDSEYTRLLELIQNHASTEILTEAIKSSQYQNKKLKRQYSLDEDCSMDIIASTSNPTVISFAASDLTETRVAAPVPNTEMLVESANSSSYRQGMEFVESFKKTRMEKGLRKMDWVTCLSEGKKRKLFNYKNTSSLRNQFAKYLKNKPNE